MRGVAIAALAMGGPGLMNVLLLGVTERSLELGVRLAVGASQIDLLVQFLMEALTLAGLGAGIGMLVGACTTVVVGRLTRADMLPGIGAMAAALAVTLGVGLLAGAYPAIRASRLNPIEALRSE